MHRMPTASLTRAVRAEDCRSEAASANWQIKRSRDNAWRADPEWIVVKPWTPEERVSKRGKASALCTSLTPDGIARD